MHSTAAAAAAHPWRVFWWEIDAFAAATMQALVSYGSEGDVFSAGTMYSSPMDSNLFLSLGSHLDAYCSPRKKSRITAPFVSPEEVVQEKQFSIDVLPDECLFEIFRRLPGGRERRACACVSKRWLFLQSSIRREETCDGKPVANEHKSEETPKGSTDEESIEEEDIGDGYLTRCVEGKRATDTRLASIAVGTSARGGLGKLIIRGSNSVRRVTKLGLSAIGRSCPSLKVLSLWNVPAVGDEGLSEIAKGCPMLKKLDLCECPLISGKGIMAIAENCPDLTSITLESCPRIGNDGLQAIARGCPNLRSLSIRDCPLVGDQGIACLVSSSSFLNNITLQGLVNVSDLSLAVIGHYGKVVTDLNLGGLNNVTEKGFWVMGNGNGLQKLRSLMIVSCGGVTDFGLEAVAKGCPNLKLLNLQRCSSVSDEGLKAFTSTSISLEILHLEECHSITQSGVLGALSYCDLKLKELSLVKCFGIRETSLPLPHLFPCRSLRSLSIRFCPGFGSAGLSMVGQLCPRLQYLDLEGTLGATDASLLNLLKNNESGLIKVSLAGCINLSDAAVIALAEEHGGTLKVLNLAGCAKISDGSLVAIAQNCYLLMDLDMEKSRVTDTGVAALARAKQLHFQVLSFSGCQNLTDSSTPFLRELGDHLLGLDLQRCSSISGTAVELLGQQLWRCDILF